MGWFDRILGNTSDPTATWGAIQSPMPMADVDERCFGSLKFGDPTSAAEFLGKPEISEFKDYINYRQLRYLKGGFEVGFEADKFSYLSFFIGPDKYNLNSASFTFSRPRLRVGGKELPELTSVLGLEEVKNIFGQPADTDEEEDETTWTYQVQGMTLEFDFDAAKKLKRCDIFPVKQPGK